MVDHEVDLARDQRGEPSGVRLNHDVDRLVDVAAAAPPIPVRDQSRADIGFVRLELVGPGAVGVAYRVGFLPGVVVLRFHDAVRRAPPLAHHGDIDQLLGQDRVGRGEQDIDGQIVDLARFHDATELEGALRILMQRALDGERDVVGSELRAVVELHPGAKLEAPAFRLELLPRYGKRSLDREVAVAKHQRLVDLTGHACLVLQRQCVRIERLRVEAAGEAQRLRGERQRRQTRRQEHGADRDRPTNFWSVVPAH